MTTHAQEVERNYQAFVSRLPDLLPVHKGRSAVMRNGDIVEIFDTFADAHVFARRHFEDGLFSVQTIRSDPVYIPSIAICRP